MVGFTPQLLYPGEGDPMDMMVGGLQNRSACGGNFTIAPVGNRTTVVQPVV